MHGRAGVGLVRRLLRSSAPSERSSTVRTAALPSRNSLDLSSRVRGLWSPPPRPQPAAADSELRGRRLLPILVLLLDALLLRRSGPHGQNRKPLLRRDAELGDGSLHAAGRMVERPGPMHLWPAFRAD